MPDAETNTDERFVDDTVTLLQTSNRRLNERVTELEARQSPQTVVEKMLSVIEEIYDAELKKRASQGCPPLPLSDQFYASKPDGTHAPVDQSIVYKIDSLWLGRIKNTKVVHDGHMKTLTLHPTKLHDDRPLPIFIDSNGGIQGIVMRHTHRTHSFIVKNDPCMPGIVFGARKASEWLALPNMTRAATSAWPHHSALERVSSMWLGRSPRVPSLSTLVVDSQLVRRFLELMSENDNARCHFTCTGQTTLHAYLCLTKADAEQSDLAMMPIGSIVE